MKQDIDRIMEEKGLDALMILGPGSHNPAMYYFTGGVHLTNAYLIKKRGESPLLFHFSMEREEASSTGLSTRDLSDYRIDKLLKEAGGDQLKANVKMLGMAIRDAGIKKGKVSLAGKTEIGSTWGIFSALQEDLQEIEFVGEVGDTTLLQAMATKDENELDRIRRMGKITTEVVGKTADFLSSHKAKDKFLVKTDGTPLSVGEVKRKINLWLAERDAENPKGTVFAIGRDAGIPHSSGTAEDLLELGKTIVFDIFPCEVGGGYFYDFTRTWCLGYASDTIQGLYEDVRNVYEQIMPGLKAGDLCLDLQDKTCDLFEAQGHPTLRSDPATREGYVHGLGHGLGLQVHERPVFGITATERDLLERGVVVTIEPGLYYPDRGMGVRLEDTICVNNEGKIEKLAEYPLDLIIPVKS